jgi:predicted N-acetyltransferase YhbS
VIELVPLSQIDPHAVEALLDASFGADRLGRTAYRMREGTRTIAGLSFAALEKGALCGTIQCWPVRLGPERLVLVGPVAVMPDAQGKGVGKLLMTEMLRVADAGWADVLMMIGDPDYYGRFFGFTAAATGGWDIPGPVERHRLLARVRRPGGIGATGMIEPDPDFALAAIPA